jgi:hypothetical protein
LNLRLEDNEDSPTRACEEEKTTLIENKTSDSPEYFKMRKLVSLEKNAYLFNQSHISLNIFIKFI